MIHTALKALGFCFLGVGCFFICCNIVTLIIARLGKKSGSFAPLVGTVFYLMGVFLNDTLRRQWYSYIPLLLDMGGIPLLSCAVIDYFLRNRKAKRNEKEAANEAVEKQGTSKILPKT
jgi:hypothetical protein